MHDGKFEEALQVLDTARDLMYTEVSALVGESYERAYKSVVKAQQVSPSKISFFFKTDFKNKNTKLTNFKRLVSVTISSRGSKFEGAHTKISLKPYQNQNLYK